MSLLPVTHLSPEQQQKAMSQIYRLCGKQVENYRKHRHLGSSTSVPVELAQDLVKSIVYTLDTAGGLGAHEDIEEGLLLGQQILSSRLLKAKTLLELVNATAPQWQTECRWEALRYFRRYLDHYDHLHFAHKGPDDLLYPIPISHPDDIRGIDRTIFYINTLWVENQIMAAIPDTLLDQLWDRLPQDALNQCEYLLINGIGKTLIGSDLSNLVFTPDEYSQLICSMANASDETLYSAAEDLCQQLNIIDDNCRKYVYAIMPQLSIWTDKRANMGNIANLFI